MKQDLTDITIVLDRSGSMSSIARETENGIRLFIDEQKKVPGQALLSLWLFDDQHERVFTAVDINGAPDFQLVARGSTALLDAVGLAIETTGKRLEQTPAHERPGKVIMVIVTDGYENASKTFTSHKINELINHQRDVYKWQFVFLGANQDAIATASQLGIQAGAALSYAANTIGTKAVYSSLGNQISSSRRTGQDISFNASERAKSMGQDEDEQKKSSGGLTNP